MTSRRCPAYQRASCTAAATSGAPPRRRPSARECGWHIRTAATYYDASQIQLQLNFSSAYNGNIELYAVDWDSAGRSETLNVGGQTATINNFNQGAWISFPINQAANSTLTITVTNTGPVNAVLSGTFLGGAGTRPDLVNRTAGQLGRDVCRRVGL